MHAGLRAAGRRPRDHGRAGQPALPWGALLQRRGGWLRRRAVVALRMYLWSRGRTPVAGRATAGGRTTGAGLMLPLGRSADASFIAQVRERVRRTLACIVDFSLGSAWS